MDGDGKEVLTYWAKVKITHPKRGYIFLRKEPNGEVLGQLYNTYNIQVLERHGMYVKVFSPDLNKTGWINFENLKSYIGDE